MAPQVLRIATRKSPLAMWQAEHVRDGLLGAHPGLRVELVPLVTQGDRVLDVALSKVGGKGLFIKELEVAMLDGRADLAVHSMKDVPMDLPQDFALSAILCREDPSDALVAKLPSLDDLPIGARIGTSSLRRQSQLRSARPDLRVSDLRGNVNTRLARFDAGEYDAIILASAGLIRLGFARRIAHRLIPEVLLPAVGQGAIGIETRADDSFTAQLVSALHDPPTAVCVEAERVMNRRLHGGCSVPIAAHALFLDDDHVWLRGLVGSVDGSRILRAEASGPSASAEQLGELVAEDLLSQGAEALLAALRASS